MLERGRGTYLGTVIGGKWWTRYHRDKLLCRGSGRWGMGEDGLYFRRYLSKTPLLFPFASLRGVDIATNHAGRHRFKPVVIRWEWVKDGLALSSGLVLDNDPGRTPVIAEQIKARIPK